MNTAMTNLELMDYLELVDTPERLDVALFNLARVVLRPAKIRAGARRHLSTAPFALMILVITALATPELAAQAPIDSARPGEATRTPSGQPWRGTLQSGAEVWVDPRTNRAITRGFGYQTQLWDGVYRLNDGNELHVRNGQVVPTTEMLEHRNATPEIRAPEALVPGGEAAAQRGATASAQRSGSRPCQALVDQACGRDNACAETTKCSAARQLLDMAAEERAQQANPKALTDTGLKCREALRDSFFAPCQASATDEDASAPAR